MDNSKDEIIEREAEERINSLADEVFELGEFFYSEKGKKEHSVLWQNKYKDIFSKIFCIKYVNKEYKKYIEMFNPVYFKKDKSELKINPIKSESKKKYQVEYTNYSIFDAIEDCLRTSLETYDKSKGVFINFFKSNFSGYLKKLYSKNDKGERKREITDEEEDETNEIYKDSESSVGAETSIENKVNLKLTKEKYLREIETVYGTLQKRQQGAFSAWMTLSLFQNYKKAEEIEKYKEYLFWSEEIFEYCIAKSNEYSEACKGKENIKKVTRRDIAEKIGLSENDFSQRISRFEEKLNALREDWKQYKIS
ncbi:MAG: hypothetical protein UHW86_05140 [Spirochaetota bacterium]|nr:hypothetical protein [Spirochaetota bacterium]